MAHEPENIVLICNPNAGGRWKQLAQILDSSEARQVRRIVTDDIEDIRPAIASLSQRTSLLCIYGGDGTIQKILNEMFRLHSEVSPQIALLGGGTMNVTSGWCGWSSSPEKNFRQVVQSYLTDQLVTRDVPLLAIQQEERLEYGFTFGAGTAIRLLDVYEKSSKGKLTALALMVKAVASAWTAKPVELQPALEQMRAEIFVDGERVPYDRFFATFCNITGRLVIGVQPFLQERQRDTFHMLAYAVDRREMSVLFPFLFRAKPPIDTRSFLKPVSSWMKIGLGYLADGSLPLDPRYVNRLAHEYELRTDEKVITIDGEIFPSTGAPIKVRLGPTVRLAIPN